MNNMLILSKANTYAMKNEYVCLDKQKSTIYQALWNFLMTFQIRLRKIFR